MTDHNARHVEISIEAYHRHPALGKSMIAAYADHPKLFDCRHVTKDGAPFKPTPSTVFGSMVDAWLLERERCVEIPPEVLSKSGSRAGGAWKEFKADHDGDILMKASDVRICERIEANIREHRDAAGLLLTGGKTQYSIFWTDKETGLECKCRPDIIPAVVVADLKTARSTTARDFANQCEALRYHWQDSHYSTGWRELTDEDRPFVFVVVRNAEPYDVATFTLSNEWVERGDREIRETLRDIADRKESGVWLPPGYGRTHELQPPKYTEYDDHYQIGEDE